MVQSPIKARGAASLLEKLTGKKCTTKQFAHLMKKAQEDYDQDTKEEQDWTFKNATSVTKLIEYLTMTRYIRFVILIHDPTTSLFNEYKYRHRWSTGDIESEDEDTRFCKKYSKKETGASYSFFVARKEPGDLERTVKHVQVGKEAMDKAVDVRKNLLLENSQAMVLAACWSTLEDIETFSLFPEILCVDTTFSTNKDRLPRLIGAGKDNNRRTFSAFPCFLPSEQICVFKFSFGHMIPYLLGEKTVRRVQQVNTDGDTAIYFPLDTLKSQPHSPWVECHHCLCTYHLINKNLSEKTSNEKKYKKYLDFIIGWVRSWAEEIESEEEYVESFKNFEEFMGRRATMEVLGQKM
jgi:hypothetical protein